MSSNGGSYTSHFLQLYRQHLEYNVIYNILITKYNILSYFRHVDDTLILYENTRTDTDHILLEINNVPKNP